MVFTYRLQYMGESLDLFRSKNSHSSEAKLICEMKADPKAIKNQLAEIVTKMVFEKFETKNHESLNWFDNLKTLLAHGFEILNSTTNQELAKSYQPVEFSLYSEKTKNFHHYGRFYKERNQSPASQFIKFCRATEYPSGINEVIVLGVLLNDGGRLIAIEVNSTTTLIQRDPETDTITGSPDVIAFFSNPITQRAD